MRPSSLNKVGHMTSREKEDRKAAVDSLNEYADLDETVPDYLDIFAKSDW